MMIDKLKRINVQYKSAELSAKRGQIRSNAFCRRFCDRHNSKTQQIISLLTSVELILVTQRKYYIDQAF